MPYSFSALQTVLLVPVIFLALAALTLLYRAWRSPFNLVQYIFYGFGYLMARARWGTEVEGRLPLEMRSGLIIVCNHRSPFDPDFIQIVSDRVVHWMVAREYCEHWALGWLFRSAEAIPVGRGGIDTAATKAAIRYAEMGDWVGMFPEGRINTTDELLLPGRPGAALVALKARVPVLPCYISGSPMGKTIFGSLLLRGNAKLVIGEVLDISEYYGREKDREVLEELTKKMLREIAKLAGHSDYEPQIAGRSWKPEE